VPQSLKMNPTSAVPQSLEDEFGFSRRGTVFAGTRTAIGSTPAAENPKPAAGRPGSPHSK
jgi:hypothetical protein